MRERPPAASASTGLHTDQEPAAPERSLPRTSGVVALLRCNGVAYGEGEARLESARIVVVDGTRRFEGGTVILAAGAIPRVLASRPFDGDRIISSDDALALTALPRRAAIVGAGAIGLEFAKIWNDFGVEVALFEAADRVLPTGDGRDSRRLILGPQASTLIHELIPAISSELLLEDIAEALHAHPTLSEAVGEAALAGLGRAIHL